MNYQVGTQYPQAVPAPAQAATNYQSSPTQYAPQSQQDNSPWESAFNKVVGLLSSPVQSPFQGQPSTPTTYSPANLRSQQPRYAELGDADLGKPTRHTPPSSSQTSSPEQLAQVADALNLSNESRQVIDAYGVEAPAVLNQYALQLEGMMDSALAWGNKGPRTTR